MLLRCRTQSLRKLVEIRGREHLDAALATGKGAILCSAHFGSYNNAFSLLHKVDAGGTPYLPMQDPRLLVLLHLEPVHYAGLARRRPRLRAVGVRA
jgi:lauroyl/myristoyl acyltransferase